MAAPRSSFPFRTVHVTALVLCAVFLPWSTAFLSMAQMLLAANWLAQGVVERSLAQRFRTGFASPPAFVFISFFLLHLAGLLWTEDMAWGLDLCRILFPIAVFTPILASSQPLSSPEWRSVLLWGAWSAIACGVFGVVFSGAGPDDYRGLSMFISHIRLALLLCMSVFVLVAFRSESRWVNVCQWAGAVVALYLINRLGSIQGFFIVGLSGAWYLWRWVAGVSNALRWSVRGTLVLVPLLLLLGCIRAIGERHVPLPAGLGSKVERTAGGEVYYHDTTNTQTENGTHVWTYLAWGELRRTWTTRSARTLDDADDKGHPLWSTAVRYLASKGVRKDSVSIMALSDTEVRAIEQGTTNVLSGRRGKLRERLEEVLFELDIYRSSGMANGHSVAMRIEFQRAGWAIARTNWLHGVGTGDTQRAFDAYYTASRSMLEPQWRLRAHNEYLTLWISFGLFGLLWSLFTWYWPARVVRAWQDPIFVAWAITFMVSCFTDDTIETQAGATFFVLYYTLFVFAAPMERSGAPTPLPRVSA